MASADTYALQTYQAIGNREDLLDIITDISPEETPMFTRFKKYKASAKYMEWQTDSLNSATSNSTIEGADFSFSRPGVRTRVGNYTQIFTNTYSVADSQEATDTAGVSSEVAYQASKAMKEHKRDIEYALINSTSSAGSSGAARTFDGVPEWISTNKTCGNSCALTETMYNTLLQDIWDEGGNPDVTYVNGWQKRKISGFSTENTRYISGEDKRLVNSVSVYESDFGLQTIILDRYVTTSILLALQEDLWGIGVFRPSKNVKVAKIADAERGAIVGEYTLVSKNEAGSGELTALATS
jgi:hypothetical protein